MRLRAGSRFGGYEIRGLIGAGGMGEVYDALDTRLSRVVALKVLSEHVAADPHRLARFAREAQLLGSLTHPNIAALYGIEQHDGVQALVLELVGGADARRSIDGGRAASRRGAVDRAADRATRWRRRTSAGSSIAT